VRALAGHGSGSGASEEARGSLKARLLAAREQDSDARAAQHGGDGRADGRHRGRLDKEHLQRPGREVAAVEADLEGRRARLVRRRDARDLRARAEGGG
jgi:hypothetical protein